jgi:hypothetical protein
MLQAAVLFSFTLLLSGVTAAVFWGYNIRRGNVRGLDPDSFFVRLFAGRVAASPARTADKPASGSGIHYFFLADQRSFSTQDVIRVATLGCNAFLPTRDLDVGDVLDQDKLMYVLRQSFAAQSDLPAFLKWSEEAPAAKRYTMSGKEGDVMGLARLIVDGFAEVNRRLDKIEAAEPEIFAFERADFIPTSKPN